MLYLIPLAESVLPVHVLDAVGHGPAVHQLQGSPLVAPPHTVNRLNGKLPDVLVWNEKWNTPEWSVVKCTRLKWEMKYAWMVCCQMYSSEMRNEIRLIGLNGQLSNVLVWNEKWNTPEWSAARCTRLKWEIKYAWIARCPRLKWEMKYTWMVRCQVYSSEMRNEIRLNGQIPDVLV